MRCLVFEALSWSVIQFFDSLRNSFFRDLFKIGPLAAGPAQGDRLESIHSKGAGYDCLKTEHSS